MIAYTIAMPRPHTHLYEVTVEIDAVLGAELDLSLPVWTPGSYLVRDYARHVQRFTAESGGRPLAWRKVDKCTWRITTSGADRIVARYAVYAFELSVRTSHLDQSHGYFNPATLCMFVPGRTHEPCTVRVEPPAGWAVTSALDPIGDAGNLFAADDYDQLVDSPFECGTHRLLSFEVDGVPHTIALWGRGNEDEAQLVADTRRIVETARAMFGSLPYPRYLFIVHLVEGGYGGLEHRNSVTNIIDRWSFRPRTSYDKFLALTSHEFFHVWNVKRIRPAPLGPFNYRAENYTRQLWAMEGITSYYDNLLLARAGLVSRERYFELLIEDIRTLQSQPGRALQSLAQSSFDAWIKLYRPDENSANTSISYYVKGALVAFLLDMEIRRRSDGARSLDDVLRYLYDRYAGPVVGELYRGDEALRPGFAEDDGLLEAVEAVAGEADGAYRAFFARYVAGTDELDYARAFETVGYELRWHHSVEPEGGGPPAWHGLRLKTEQGRLKVIATVAGGPGEEAGVYAGDELIALDGSRIDDERLRARLAERAPGTQVRLTLFRRDELLEVPLTLGAAPPDTVSVVPVAAPTEQQQLRLAAWLGSAER